jgi:hypothetical protein
MPSLSDARNSQERGAWVTHWQESVTALVERVTHDIDPRDGEVEGTPDESEYALLRALPARIVEMKPEEARTLWEPILTLAPIAHYWVESFINDWFMIGLQSAPACDAFTREWEAMLDYAEDPQTWSSARPSYRLLELHSLLLGLDGFALTLWSAEHAPLIVRMASRYQRWASKRLYRREDAAQFARLLGQPGAQPLLDDGLEWLAAADTPAASGSYRDDRYEDAVGELLDHVARHHSERPRSPTEAGDAYRALLRRLVDRQVPIALELTSRLSAPVASEASQRHVQNTA